MKKKDIIYMVLAAAIFLVAGYVAYANLVPQGAAASAGVKVEVVGSISANFDPTAQAKISDPSQVKDYSVRIDLTTGLGNPAPFGQ